MIDMELYDEVTLPCARLDTGIAMLDDLSCDNDTPRHLQGRLDFMARALAREVSAIRETLKALNLSEPTRAAAE